MIFRIKGVRIIRANNLKGSNNLFDLDDFSNYRSSNYMSSTVFSIELTMFCRTSYYFSFTEKYDILPSSANCYAPL